MNLFFPGGAETPNIRGMAKKGLLYKHAFSNAPVCSVARTTLMTGCYAPRIGTQYHRRAVSVPMPEGVMMFPRYLRDAGYYTTNRQKKDYNADETEGTWDESSKKATWRNRADGQPFFHMQSFGTTHESSLHFKEDVFKNQKTKTDPQSVPVQPYFPDTDLFRYTIARYHDNMVKVDQEIGRVLQQLREDDLQDDTFVFYFGDHGGVLPRGKGYCYESGLHVPLVIQVPKNFRDLSPWQAKETVGGFVEFVDFSATTLALAGVDVPEGIDGKAFLGAGISRDEVESRDTAFGYADRFDEKYDFVRTLRKGKYEYVRSYQPFNFDGLQNNYRYIMLAYQQWRDMYRAGKLNEVQSQFFRSRPPEMLFDVEADPHEVNDLSKDPAYAEILSELRAELRSRVKSMPDLSFAPESVLVDQGFDNPVGFGQAIKEYLAAVVDVADLSLVPFEEAQAEIAAALKSNEKVERYWGVIVCTSFGKPALKFQPQIAALRDNSEEQRQIRVRAAEFLSMWAGQSAQATLLDCLGAAESGVEANEYLNTAVLLRDGKAGDDIKISAQDISEDARDFQDVQRRLSYFAAEDGKPQNPRGVKPAGKKARQP
jgi:arylsulfatase A-like enzyme